jgi:hypothetical protein
MCESAAYEIMVDPSTEAPFVTMKLVQAVDGLMEKIIPMKIKKLE